MNTQSFPDTRCTKMFVPRGILAHLIGRELQLTLISVRKSYSVPRLNGLVMKTAIAPKDHTHLALLVQIIPGPFRTQSEKKSSGKHIIQPYTHALYTVRHIWIFAFVWGTL